MGNDRLELIHKMIVNYLLSSHMLANVSENRSLP